uniref:Uncharacterized protein n=1 Tax=Magallana gigas TaxID=29159 RepID=K1R762_MAGGI
MTTFYLEVPLKDIEKSPIKSMLSVRRLRKLPELFVNGRDTKVKSVTIKDDNGKCKVSLWRDLAASDIEVDAPRSTTVTTEIIAFNMEDSCKVSVVINDGEPIVFLTWSKTRGCTETTCVMADANTAVESRVDEKAVKGRKKVPGKGAYSEKTSSTRSISNTASTSSRVHSDHSSNAGGHDSAPNAEILSILRTI